MKIDAAITLALSLAFASGSSRAQVPDSAVRDTKILETAAQESKITDVREASQVRIVRLSQVTEKVELDRNTGGGFEPTLINLPVVQGNRLRTQRGWAEVEFEDNSTLRIAPDTLVDFSTLGRTAAGNTLNTIRLTRGTLYVSLARTRDLDFTVDVGTKAIALLPGSHIRIDVYPAGSEIYVFQGHVTVVDPSGSRTIEKAHALKFGTPGEPQPLVVRDDTPGLYDEWDRTAVKYHSFIPSGASTYAYGNRDLTSYGQFAEMSGCGQMWTPYFSNASFDPFANGAWAWYPGSGYTFVSAYPWGWLPYHSGAWANCGGRWGWQPTGGWHGLENHPITRPIKGPAGFHPVQIPVARPAGKASFVLTGSPTLTPSQVKGDKFVFSKDSAGVGVPRDAFGNLAKLSAQLDRRGWVQRSIEPVTAFAAPANGGMRSSGGSRATAGSHLESRPVATSSSSDSGSSSSGRWMASGAGAPSPGAHVTSTIAAPVTSGGGGSSASSTAGSHH